MSSVFIKNNMAAGDILMLTSAIRDLKKSHPEIHIGVGTSFMDLWYNNPNIDRKVTEDTATQVVYADYPLYKKNNVLPYHFIHGFRKHLEDALQLPIEQGPFKVDIHLTEEEKDREWVNIVLGTDKPYWIINASSKRDFTIKQWDVSRYQEVINRTKDKILWVQTGYSKDSSSDLYDVIDLRGLTSIRQMCQLMYYASGVLTPVSFPMHLATMDTPLPNTKRPCVVVAGGREPSQWEAYTTHKFLHNCGCYPCNREGGCWMSRVSKLNDNTRHDNLLCKMPTTTENGFSIAQCMKDITVDMVVEAINSYLQYPVIY